SISCSSASSRCAIIGSSRRFVWRMSSTAWAARWSRSCVVRLMTPSYTVKHSVLSAENHYTFVDILRSKVPEFTSGRDDGPGLLLRRRLRHDRFMRTGQRAVLRQLAGRDERDGGNRDTDPERQMAVVIVLPQPGSADGD